MEEITLNQIKSAFLYILSNMGLDEIDEEEAEELLAQRFYSEFENRWEELSDNSPEINDSQYKQILNDANEICKSICNSIHHELEVCIYDDYILIATYLIADVDDRYAAGILQSYINNEIPTGISMLFTDKSLQVIFNEFQLTKNLK